MALFFDVKVTTANGIRTVAHMVITRNEDEAAGRLYSYRVDAMRHDMRTEERIETTGEVRDHDREHPVWLLIGKAIASII